MDFWSTVLVVLRRWYVALPVFLLCLGAARAVYQSVPVHYASVSVVVLTAPTNGGTLFGGPTTPTTVTNPLLNFQAGLNTSGAVLVQALNSPAVVEELTTAAGPGTSYQVNNGSTNPELMISSPFLYIQGEGTSAAGAMDIVVRVTQRAREELAREQQSLDAPPSTHITGAVFVPPTTPILQRGGKIRSLIVALMISIIASLTATFAAESLIEAHRRRRLRRQIVTTGADGARRNGSRLGWETDSAMSIQAHGPIGGNGNRAVNRGRPQDGQLTGHNSADETER